MGGVLDVLRLYRLHSGAATASVALVPGLVAGAGIPTLVVIFIACMAHHAWGFSLNEIMDLEVDSCSGIHPHKPLVSGRISKRIAHLISTTALIISLASFLAASYMESGYIVLTLALVVGATVAGAIYDIRGKNFPLSDIFVGGWLFFLVLASASASAGTGGFVTAVWAAAVLGALHLVFNNSVEGGLKDTEGDRRAGVRSLAVLLGVRSRGSKVLIPPAFRAWGMTLRGVFIILAAVFSYLISVREGWGSWVVVVVSVWGVFLFAHSLLFLRTGERHPRKKMIRTFSVHEVLSFGLSLLVVAPAVGILGAVFLLVLSLVWFMVMNRIMYGTSISPKV
ncbi:MAG: UbiA family prenyltransferase [Thermoplasmatota archaeon]